MRTVAEWAIEGKLWGPHASLLIGQCADELARAMREEFISDKQGRRVRAKHAVRSKGEQTALWDDIRTAPRDFMLTAFQQRRQQIVGDCTQLKIDVESFNDNRSGSDPIQMSFDFTRDIEERGLADS